jgi:EAL domain-containing protein (putative c-di-GMP-specific phosphodiesterase class I)
LVLKRLPLSTLKLDRSFVRDLPHDVRDSAIVRAIRSIAAALRLDVVAEGVETEDQRAFLAGIGCEQAHGYLFGRPVAPEALRCTLRAA